MERAAAAKELVKIAKLLSARTGNVQDAIGIRDYATVIFELGTQVLTDPDLDDMGLSPRDSRVVKQLARNLMSTASHIQNLSRDAENMINKISNYIPL